MGEGTQNLDPHRGTDVGSLWEHTVGFSWSQAGLPKEVIKRSVEILETWLHVLLITLQLCHLPCLQLRTPRLNNQMTQRGHSVMAGEGVELRFKSWFPPTTLEQRIPSRRSCEAARTLGPGAWVWVSPSPHASPKSHLTIISTPFNGSQGRHSVKPKALIHHRKTTKETCKEPYRYLHPHVKGQDGDRGA